MKTDRPTIPNIGTGVDPNVRRAFDSLRSWFDDLFANGGGIATKRDLITTGVITATGTPALATAADNGGIPTMVENVQAAGMTGGVKVSWHNMYFDQLAYYEVWRSGTELTADATLIGTTSSRQFIDMPADSATYHYWVRQMSKAGVYGPWSTSASAAAQENSAISSLDARVTTLEGSVATLEGSVATHTSQISNILGRLTAHGI